MDDRTDRYSGRTDRYTVVSRIDKTDRFSGLGRKVLQTGWTGMADRTDRYSRQDRQTVY